jgi:hypothetical protein
MKGTFMNILPSLLNMGQLQKHWDMNKILGLGPQLYFLFHISENCIKIEILLA